MKKLHLLTMAIFLILVAVIFAFISGNVPKGIYAVDNISHSVSGMADDEGTATAPDTFNETVKTTGRAIAGANKSGARVEIVTNPRRGGNMRVTCDLDSHTVRTSAPEAKKTIAEANASGELTFILPEDGNWALQINEYHSISAHNNNAAADYTWKIKLTDAYLSAPLIEKEQEPVHSVNSPPSQSKNNTGQPFRFSQSVFLRRGVRYTLSCEASVSSSTIKQAVEETIEGVSGFTYPIGDGSVRVSASLVHIK